MQARFGRLDAQHEHAVYVTLPAPGMSAKVRLRSATAITLLALEVGPVAVDLVKLLQQEFVLDKLCKRQ